MGWLAAVGRQVRDMLSLPYRLDAGPAHTFDTTPRPIDQVIAEMLGTGRNARISRADALSVAAVQRGRNELCAIATLPLRLYRGLDVVPSPLLRQIDPDVANVITLAATVEDLIFEGISWWQVTGQDFDGYPVSARHVDVDKVSLRPPAGKQDPTHTPAGYTSPGKPSGPYVWVDGEPVSAALMIRFDSPNPGLLRANARAIRRALLLDQLAAMFAENPQLREYFTDGDSAEVDPMSDDEIDAFIAEYMAKRRLRPVGWIPSNVKRADVNTPSPVDLQLVQLQQQVTLEIALGIGVDPEDLGVRTTSRTYFNGVDRRQEKVNRTYGPYMKAITDRLSMGDVTRRGYETRFDLTDYLKSDPLTQAQYWEALQRMGAIDSNEIRALAGFSGPAPKTAPAPAAAVENSRAPLQLGDITPDRRAIGHRFDGETMTFAVRDFAAVATEAPKVDAESRTITGLALPYNAVAQKYGIKYRFKPGSLEYDPANLSHLKHLQNHGSPVGVHLAVDDTKAGPVVKLSVLDGIEGSPEKMQRDQLLYDAANGLYDGLSVGVEFSLYPDDGDVVFSEEDGVYDVVRATWRETSSTPLPAFTGARVTKVAASLQGGNEMDPCQHCGQRHNPGIACATFAAQLRTAPTTAPAGQPAPAGPAGTATEPAPDALAAFTAAMREFVATQGPTLVNPHHGPARVTEPAPYRFDARGNIRPGTHDFSTDLIAGLRDKDQGAYDRALSFVQAQFDVVSTDVNELNPTRNRPDMYVDQREFRYPIWEAINKGALGDITPFTFPKFNSASGLVGNHTEGTEPTSGTFTVTNQTVTPTPTSGKAKITREVWDQGGNPQVSNLIWRQMQKAWYEALEAAAVAALDAVTPTAIALTAGGGTTGQTLDSELTAAFAGLQFVRGGFSMTDMFTQIDLYKAMVAAKDTAGRRLYPAIGPTNASGTVRSRFAAIDVNGVVALPAWALAATGSVVASSYLFDRESVHGWASAPNKLDITNTEVAHVYIGIWGYKATAISDINGVREITYDPVP